MQLVYFSDESDLENKEIKIYIINALQLTTYKNYMFANNKKQTKNKTCDAIINFTKQ